MRDTAALSLIEVGAYQRLLNFYYSGGVLPASMQDLFRICAAFTNDEQNAVKKVVAFFFKKRGDFVINLRVEKELQIAKEFKQKQSDNGRLRHKNNPKYKLATAKPPLSQNLAKIQPIQIPDTSTINNINTGKSASPVLEEKKEESTPNFTDVRDQLAKGMTFKATRGISRQWQEEAFRYAKELEIVLDNSQKGRWLKFFKEAHETQQQLKPKLQIAYSYLSDLPAFKRCTSEQKIRFFFDVTYKGPELYKNNFTNSQIYQ